MLNTDVTAKKNLFSLDNIGEIADFDEHIGFAEKMIGKYRWEDSVKENLVSLLEQIKSKQADKQLNLSVIGEFSTGKSTFINAMLRKELLVSSALQGTTVASTVIEYAKTYGIFMQFYDGDRRAYTYRTLEELKQSIESFTTDPDVAKNIQTVRVYLPSPQLEKGFRIIDTPGTNAIELWHEEITIRTLRDISDVSIVLIDATKPLPESFCRFVENNLESILPQCVFVVTKLDLIAKRERTRMLSYIAMKLKQTFGLEDPKVLGYASTEVVRDFTSSPPDPELADMLEESYRNEEIILAHMAKQRTIIQTKKLIALIDGMYGSISEQINELQKGHRDELELLLKTKQVDLTSFISSQKSKRLSSFSNTARFERGEIINSFHELSDRAYGDVMSDIDSITTVDGLKEFVTSRLAGKCSEEAQKIIIFAEGKYSCVCRWFQDEMKEFRNSFEELFNDLEILKVDLRGSNYVIPGFDRIETADLGEAGRYVAEQVSKDNKAFWGGAAAGALAGTAIAPGVGTVIGGFLGMIGGAFFAPDIYEVKKSTKEKLSIPLKGYFDKVVARASSGLDKYTNQIGQCIFTEIDRYLAKYNQTVEKRIRDEQKKISSVEAKIAETKADLNDIENRKFRLGSISAQVNSLGRKE